MLSVLLLDLDMKGRPLGRKLQDNMAFLGIRSLSCVWTDLWKSSSGSNFKPLLNITYLLKCFHFVDTFWWHVLRNLWLSTDIHKQEQANQAQALPNNLCVCENFTLHWPCAKCLTSYIEGCTFLKII